MPWPSCSGVWRRSTAAGSPAARVTTVAAILDLVAADYRAQGRRSLPRCELACKHVKASLGHTLARDLTYSDLNTYVAECRARGWQPATIWYDLAILRRAYTLARKEGLLTTRPEFPNITVDNARQGFFERADFEKMLGELQSETAKNVITFAYLTGWRTRSEILPLTWDRVDFTAGVVRLEVRQSKNGKGRTFPFDAMPELGAVLGRQKLAADAFEAIHGFNLGVGMTKLSEAQLSQVKAALQAAGARKDCVACGNPLSLDHNLYGLELGAAARAAATANPTGRAIMCASPTCTRCGDVQLHALGSLGLHEMI
jgi:integrase